MSKQRVYNDYQSVWRNKPEELIRLEVKNVEAWASNDKWLAKDDLASEDKLDILHGILGDRG